MLLGVPLPAGLPGSRGGTSVSLRQRRSLLRVGACHPFTALRTFDTRRMKCQPHSFLPQPGAFVQ